ncbi:MAG TPA: CBS domain-containing protein [Candidatus Nitrosotenuis sp.]|nr:CBS domain-containing protein [Candidatus Nitrosotenuis sp.]
MKVADYMTRELVTVRPDTSFLEAGRLMRKNRIRRLPVVDEQGHLVGIVTDRDIRSHRPSEATSLDVWELHELIDRLKVRDVMKRSVVTVTPETPIEDAAVLMRHEKVGGLPVVEGGKPVGIITESDLFDAFTDVFRRLRQEGRTL